MTLTVEQRRMVVEYFATKCVEEMPSDDMPMAEFYRGLHSEEWRLRTMKAIEKVIPEHYWARLVDDLLAYQTFDRDPLTWMVQEGFMTETEVSTRDYLNDLASVAIDNVARY